MSPSIRLGSPDSSTPAGRLIAGLGLELRTTAEIQDLYSRPIVTVTLTLERGAGRPVPAVRAA